MSVDPERRGREIAALYLTQAPRLFADIVESDVWSAASKSRPDAPVPATVARARREWDVFALYACVRGLVAAGGFNRETAAAIDALHEQVTSGHDAEDEPLEAWRPRVAERYAEYGAIGQAGGKSGAASVTIRLGEAAARHMTGAEPAEDLAELVGALHESLAETITEQIRNPR